MNSLELRVLELERKFEEFTSDNIRIDSHAKYGEPKGALPSSNEHDDDPFNRTSGVLRP